MSAHTFVVELRRRHVGDFVGRQLSLELLLRIVLVSEINVGIE
jgi:hypothetical protein